MRFFQKRDSDNYIVIIGCGRLGANLAAAMAAKGQDVLIIDENKDAFRKLSPAFSGHFVVGDGTDFDVLRDAKIDKAQSVIVVTNNDNVNVMIAQTAREIFSAKKVVARLYDSSLECILRDMGINTVCPAELSIRQITNALSNNIVAQENRMEALQ